VLEVAASGNVGYYTINFLNKHLHTYNCETSFGVNFFLIAPLVLQFNSVGRKISREGEATEKRLKISKKKTKNNTI